MAIVAMAPAVAGNVAVAAEYNKLISNITDLDTRTTAVEAAVGGGTGEVPRKGGEFSFGASTQSITAASGRLLTQWAAVGTPTGVSHSAGTFTVTDAGLYVITANIRWTSTGTISTERYCMITGNASAGDGTGDTWAKNSHGGATFNTTVSTIKRLAAGTGIKVWAYCGITTTVGREAAGDSVPAVSIYKVGN